MLTQLANQHEVDTLNLRRVSFDIHTNQRVWKNNCFVPCVQIWTSCILLSAYSGLESAK